jgi:hypothetical protein
MSDLKINHPCWGHNCEKYTKAEIFYEEVVKVWKNQDERPLLFEMFLLELGIVPSTIEHWKTCKPDNLKVLERVKLYSNSSIFHAIKGNPNAILKFWELTTEKEVIDTENKIQLNSLLKTDKENTNEF